MLKKVYIEGVRAEFTYSGIITMGDLMKGYVKLLNHPNFLTLNQQVWIYEKVENITVGREEIFQMITASNKLPTLPKNLKVAIVSKSDLAFGLARMYASFSEQSPWMTMVFRNKQEAEKWFNTSIE